MGVISQQCEQVGVGRSRRPLHELEHALRGLDDRGVHDRQLVGLEDGQDAIPTLTRRISGVPSVAMTERTPLWPPALPFMRARTAPSGRSMSS
jgi:hypothetical protein